MDDQDDTEDGLRRQVVEDLVQSARPNLRFFLLIALSCIIATAGLITNSVAVIIGAMLIAPLVPPIMGIALASLGDRKALFANSMVASVSGAIMAISLAALLAWIAKSLPFDALSSIPSEVKSRTQPNPFDLTIAIAGGVAGAYATVRPRIATTIGGVAIATALMPPLCVVGIGIALGQSYIWSGAFLLFVANLIAIAAASIVVFAISGFRPRKSVTSGLEIVVAALSLIAVGVLLVAATVRSVRDAKYSDNIRSAAATAVRSRGAGADLVELTHSVSGDTLKLQLTVQAPGNLGFNDALAIQEDIAKDLNRKTAIVLVTIPVVTLDPLKPPTRTPTRTPTPTRTQTPTGTPTRTPTPRPSTSPTRTTTPSVTTTPTSP